MLDSKKVVISGSAWVEEDTSQLFIPRLNNAYEQKLYEQVLEKTGIEFWRIKKFAESAGLPHMQAMETAFNDAVKDAGLQRKIKKKNGGRIGLIYFDQYGPISFMERQAQIKEMYYSDVFPSLVLQNHNISGYSVRLRAERNAAMQAIKLSQDLIQSGDLDIVFVGGVNPCYSFFYLTEQLETHNWERQQGIKPKYLSDTRQLSEAASFIVLESAENAESRGHETKALITNIESSREYYSVKKAADNPLPQKWESINREFEVDTAWMGLYQSELIERTELMLLKDVFSDIQINNLSKLSSDASCLNPLRILHNQVKIEITDANASKSVQLIHSTDRSGFGWNLITK